MSWPARWMRIAPVAEEAGRWAILAALAGAQRETDPPLAVWVQGNLRHDWAFVVPRRFAPGKPSRRAAWALSPAIALCRQFGVPAYFEADGLHLHGQPWAGCRVEMVGECLVAASCMTIPFPVESHVEDCFRLRVEAQYDWCFETSWPNPVEANAIAEARSEYAW